MSVQGRADAVARLRSTLGVHIDPELLDLAMTHRSYAFEAGGLPTNERLEFLGDAVLELIITRRLYLTHPERPESELAKMRASVVNARALASVATAVGVGECVYLGRGEVTSGGAQKPSILADTMEAVIASAYLSSGLEATEDMVLRLFEPLIDRAADLGAGLDWKTSLQELTKRLGLGVPDYQVTAEGPDHAKHFQAEVHIGGRVLGAGDGSSKKLAEQHAAEAAWQGLKGEGGEADAVQADAAEADAGEADVVQAD